jgi:hypothetical protein
MVNAGRLHVVPSEEVTINAELSVTLYDPDMAAVTQQAIADALDELINTRWRAREIGAQINVNELYRAVKSIPNVASIIRIFPEGCFLRDGRRVVIALDSDYDLPFATAVGGEYSIKIG